MDDLLSHASGAAFLIAGLIIIVGLHLFWIFFSRTLSQLTLALDKNTSALQHFEIRLRRLEDKIRA